MQSEKGRKREREQQSEAGTDDQKAGGAVSSASATEALAALEAVKARSWDTLKSFNMSPGEMLTGLMQWSDVEQAADFFAKCPWPLSGTGRSVKRGRYGVHPPQWDGSQYSAGEPRQGELADFLDAILDCKPPLDRAGMKRAGQIVRCWDDWDKRGRINAMLCVWRDELKVAPALVESFVEGSGFLYYSDDEDAYSD